MDGGIGRSQPQWLDVSYRYFRSHHRNDAGDSPSSCSPNRGYLGSSASGRRFDTDWLERHRRTRYRTLVYEFGVVCGDLSCDAEFTVDYYLLVIEIAC